MALYAAEVDLERSTPIENLESTFPDLRPLAADVPIPFVVISGPAADFNNSKKEVEQLAAWVAKLDYGGVVRLLKKMYEYRRGSLYCFMYWWCRVGENFDPTTGDGGLQKTNYELDWEESREDSLRLVSKPKDDGSSMWNALRRRASRHTVDLRRVLHFLLFLYSNDRLKTTLLSGEQSLPGELVLKMKELLKNDTSDVTWVPFPSPTVFKEAAYRTVSYPSRRTEQRRLAHGGQEFSYTYSQAEGPCFEKLAPGWVKYMRGQLGTLRKALAIPPFDDGPEIEKVYAEDFLRGTGAPIWKRKRACMENAGGQVVAGSNPAEEEIMNRVHCVVCIAAKRSVVLLPCSHFIACQRCSATLDTCPTCTAPVSGKLGVLF